MLIVVAKKSRNCQTFFPADAQQFCEQSEKTDFYCERSLFWTASGTNWSFMLSPPSTSIFARDKEVFGRSASKNTNTETRQDIKFLYFSFLTTISLRFEGRQLYIRFCDEIDSWFFRAADGKLAMQNVNRCRLFDKDANFRGRRCKLN